MSAKRAFSIRTMSKENVPAALSVMKDLAAFEHYLDAFRVTEDDLLRFGLGAARRFTCFVAAEKTGGALTGFAVIHEDPWNDQMAPTFVLKELFVAAEARGRGVGAALFNAAAAHVRDAGAPAQDWQVWDMPSLASPRAGRPSCRHRAPIG